MGMIGNGAAQGRLPDFLVIGAQRAGTTLLHGILAAHPEVYVPQARKEVHFFDWYFERGEGWYRRFFPNGAAAARFAAVGEATPDYLATAAAPARIHALLPGCRLVAILRQPAARAWSWYQYARRSYHEEQSFEAFLEHDPTVLEWGLYHHHLERYLSHFPRAALLVLIYEELVRDPAGELARLAAFLRLTQDWPDPKALLERRVNTSAPPRLRRSFALARRAGELLMRHDINWPNRLAKRLGVPRLFGSAPPGPGMAPATRTWLAAYYRDDVARLERLLGRELALWRAGPRPAAEGRSELTSPGAPSMHTPSPSGCAAPR